MLMVSGMVKISLYPLTAATMAKPIPVLPLVGSMRVAPGLIMPCFSASTIMLRQMRSLTLPPGLRASSFALLWRLCLGLVCLVLLVVFFLWFLGRFGKFLSF